MKSFATLASIVAANAAVSAVSSENVEALFEQFIVDFDRSYRSDAEKAHRFEIFRDNVSQVERLNAQKSGVTYGINNFSDLLSVEVEEMNMRGFSLPAGLDGASLVPGVSSSGANESVDYASCYLGVRDQSQCGSCWAFAAAAVTEGQSCVVNNEKVDLAPQHLVDCDKRDKGCKGGMLDAPLEFIVKNGLCTEDDYKYTGTDGSFFFKNKCKESNCGKKHKLSSFKQIGNNAQDLIDALKNGPISVAVGVTSKFQSYSSGVMTVAECGSTQLNHAVTVVGYEKINNKDVFKIRNSWSAKWGSKGYIQLEFSACGLGSLNYAGILAKDNIVRI